MLNCILVRWKGEGLDQQGIDEKTGKVRVKVNAKYYRPTEVVSNHMTW